MKHVKPFLSFVNENEKLSDDGIAEVYFWLRHDGNNEETVTDFVLKEFNIDADSLGELLNSWLTANEWDGTIDDFVNHTPTWFASLGMDRDSETVKKFNEK